MNELNIIRLLTGMVSLLLSFVKKKYLEERIKGIANEEEYKTLLSAVDNAMEKVDSLMEGKQWK